jgi:RHS repeat-associated protein
VDGIGRRNFGNNQQDALNRFLVMTHPLDPKNIYISAAPTARLWINGIEAQQFAGVWAHPITHPGAQGGWVPWHVKGVLEGAGDPGAHDHAVAEYSGHLWFPPATEEFEFDADGNREGSSMWDYGWDGRNKLVRARTKDWDTAPEGWDLRFDYDAEGRRFKKSVTHYAEGVMVEQKVVYFIWDGWDLLFERHEDIGGNPLKERRYVWGPDINDGSAGGAGGLLLIRETRGQTITDYYPLYDGTGHVVGLTDITGTLQAEYWWGPFGELISATGPKAQSNPWRFQTKYLDEETGLYYFGHRYYDPGTGQFLSRDKLGEDEDLNLYRMTGNDPINKVDVLGLAAVVVSSQEMADQLRVEWLLDQVRMSMELPVGPPEWASGKYTEWGNDFGLFAPYGQNDFQRAHQVAYLSGSPSITPVSEAEAEARRRAARLEAPAWNPTHTRALTLGAANTPLNASINQDWLLPSGAGTLGARFALRGMEPMLPILSTGVRMEGRFFASEVQLARMTPDFATSKTVYHTVTTPNHAHGILKGIDPAFLNPNSRFGRAFYLSDEAGTTLRELFHHSAPSTHTIRFNLNLNQAKILDLGDPAIAKAWGYAADPISEATKSIGPRAMSAGFNIIKVPSLRGPGTNYTVLSDFDQLLFPQGIVPSIPTP